MSIQITEKQLSERQTALILEGHLDAPTAPGLKTQIKRPVEDGYTQLVIDLTGVPFIDSSGLAALVSGLEAAREVGGTLKLVGLGKQARTAFELTRLDRVFEFDFDAD